MRVHRGTWNPTEGSLESKALYQTLSKAFEMSKATTKVSPKKLRKDDQELVRKQENHKQSAPYGIHTGDQKEGWRLIDI